MTLADGKLPGTSERLKRLAVIKILPCSLPRGRYPEGFVPHEYGVHEGRSIPAQ